MAKHIAEYVSAEIERLGKLVDRIGVTEEQRAVIALAAAKLNDKFSSGKSKNHHVEQVQQAKRTGVLFSEPTDAPPLASRLKPTAEDFDRFWKVFPRRVNKAKACEAFDRAFKKLRAKHPAEKCVSIIVNGAKVYAERANPDVLCHPTTWLNGERWDDDPDGIWAGERPKGSAGVMLGAFKREHEDETVEEQLRRMQ